MNSLNTVPDPSSAVAQLAAAQASIDRVTAALQAAGLPLPAEIIGLAADIGRLQSDLAQGRLSAMDLARLPGLIDAVQREAGRAEGFAAASRQQHQALARSAAEADFQATLQQFDRGYAAFLQETMVIPSEQTEAAIADANDALIAARASGDPARIRVAELALREAQLRQVQEAADKGDAAGEAFLPQLSQAVVALRAAEAAIARAESERAAPEAVEAAQKAAKPFQGLPDQETLSQIVADMQADPAHPKLSGVAATAMAEGSSFEQFALPKAPSADRGRTS